MFHDVRMRGFKRRADVDEVVAWLDALPVEARAETVDLEAAHGRVLAEPLVSAVDVPGFDRSAMDGWAVCGEDTFGATETDPRTLRVLGSALPAKPFAGRVGNGEATRIMTGAPLPAGADTVLRAEDGRQDGDTLTVRAAVPVGRHVGRVGEDIAQGVEVLGAGRILRPQDLGVAHSVGAHQLPVRTRPTVSLLITGDEILAPGAAPALASIRDANGPMLRALVARDDGVCLPAHYVPDGAEAVREALHAAQGDVILVTGGSSVGEEDHAPRLLHEEGTLTWHGVGLRPAAPTGIGHLAGRPVFLLPGNPVSCLCAYDFFAGRLVRRLAGRRTAWPYAAVRRTLTRKIASVLGRVDYVRVAVDTDTVEPVMSSGASILSSTTESDGFVVVPKDHEGWAEGSEVEVFLYDQPEDYDRLVGSPS